MSWKRFDEAVLPACLILIGFICAGALLHVLGAPKILVHIVAGPAAILFPFLYAFATLRAMHTGEYTTIGGLLRESVEPITEEPDQEPKPDPSRPPVLRVLDGGAPRR